MTHYIFPGVFHVAAGEHSRLGPSSAERWINCPASVKHTAIYPDEQSEFAAEGSAAHYLADVGFVEGIAPQAFVGSTIVVGKHSFSIDEGFAAYVQEYLDWCSEFGGEHVSETKVGYEAYVPGGFGTMDRASFKDGVCTIIDLKFGQGVQVFANENKQLMLYALGILETFGWLYDITDFNLGVHQPRIDHKDMWPISTKALLEWANATLPEAVREVNLGKRFKAGEWCSKSFCKVRNTCMVRANLATQAIFGDLDALEGAVDPVTCSSKQKAELLEKLPVMKAWIKDFERGVMADLIGGKPVGEWKLVEGRSNRKWDDPDAAALALQHHGIDPWEKSLISVAVAEKAVGKKKFAAELAGRVVKPPGKPVLAPGSDPRDKMNTTSVVGFSNLDDDET